MTGSSQESYLIPPQPDPAGLIPLPVGAPVRVAMTKWGDQPHWEFDAVFLGRDEHGEWAGCPAGTRMSRPGAEYVAPVDQVCLVPQPATGSGSDLARSFLATFHAPGGQVSLYVDMTTPALWTGEALTAVDLDLDVVRGTTGRVWIDDEDEFAEHRVTLDYPLRIVALASASCDRVHGLVHAGAAPFDAATPQPWFAVLESLVADGVTDRPSPGGPRAV
ncbi:conserved hypothetical protein [metagenome]|uniref:DUF402 domain-containing protein n=1 Tax=metagenome TaxID=256318 RepID=A0A2P2CAG2_9ZZZZ